MATDIKVKINECIKTANQQRVLFTEKMEGYMDDDEINRFFDDCVIYMKLAIRALSTIDDMSKEIKRLKEVL